MEIPRSRTVFLAKQLGLIETLSTITTQRRGTTEFSHLIIIDFESTCWKDRKGNPEIIEFPAILIEMQNGTILDEFHEYLSPTENPRLSDFCKQFTGITQDMVEEGLPLKACLPKFVNWVGAVKKKFNVRSVALVTWSDWDLNICLLQECRRKCLSKPSIFNQWIDLRKLYKSHAQLPSRGLRAAVTDSGLEFGGREHSGIWDARNTARLAWKLYCDGMDIKITKNIDCK